MTSERSTSAEPRPTVDPPRPTVSPTSTRPPAPADEPAAAAVAMPDSVADTWPLLSEGGRKGIVALVDEIAALCHQEDRPESDLATIAKAWPMLPQTLRAEVRERMSLELAIRWRYAVHEAGHIIPALVFNEDGTSSGKCVRAALGKNLGGACDWIGRPVTMVSIAYWVHVAGGPIAVTLIDELGLPPPLPRRTLDEAIHRPPTGDAEYVEQTGWVEAASLGRTDAVSLALVAIDGIEGRPKAWAERHAEILAAARGLLEGHLSALAVAAARLYLNGYLVVKSLDELSENMEKGEPDDESD